MKQEENKMARIVSYALVMCMSVVLFSNSSASNLPRSRTGTLIESTSPTEVMVKAGGIGYWEKGMSSKKDIDKFLAESAETDARKAAVYFILFGGTDPLLRSPDEKASFERIQEDFFTTENIRKYIAWEGTEYISRVKKPIQKNKKYELHIEKAYKINKQAVSAFLEQNGIIAAVKALAETLGLPFIMVIPSVEKGVNPIETLRKDPNLSHAAKVIEGYLTARTYDVVVPEQQIALSELSSAQQALSGLADDYSYQLALSIGSDVYITFEASIEKDKLNTKKAVASVRAFETTTARLLGTETGYSPSAQVADKVLIENAVNDAIDKVLSRITAYWKEDMGRGVQYKLVISIAPGFNSEQSEEISFAFADLLEKIARNKQYKENIVTRQTLDYLVWCDSEKYSTSTKLFRDIKSHFSEEFTGGTVQKVNINRKLLLLKIESE